MPAISGGHPVSHTAEPGVEVRAVTPDDDTTLQITTEAEPEPRFPRALWIGVAGDVELLALKDASAVLLTNVPVGILPIRCRKVMENTTADEIFAIY